MDNQREPAGNSDLATPQSPLTSRWFWYLVAIASTFVVVIAVVRLLFPVTQPTVSPSEISLPNIDGSKSTFSDLRFVGSVPEFSSRLPTAKLSQEPSSVEKRLVEFFELNPSVDVVGEWQSSQYSMSYDTANRVFTVTSLNSITLQSNPPLGFESSPQAISEEILQQLFPDQELQLLKDETLSFFSAPGGHYQPTDPKNAVVFHGSASYTINDIPVYIDSDFRPPVVFDITNDGRINSLKVRSGMLSYELQEVSTLLTIEEALAQLLSSQTGTIIESYIESSTTVIDISDIRGGQLESVALEYRVNTDSGLIVPHYRFGGRVTNAQGYAYNVQLITPAVRLE